MTIWTKARAKLDTLVIMLLRNKTKSKREEVRVEAGSCGVMLFGVCDDYFHRDP